MLGECCIFSHRTQGTPFEYLILRVINPCPAELFELYFSLFEAGIANAISSFKWRKIFLFFENIHLLNWVIRQQNIYHQLYYPFQWHIIWLKICLKPYISGSSRARANRGDRVPEGSGCRSSLRWFIMCITTSSDDWWSSQSTNPQPFKPSRCIKASYYFPENILNFPTTKGFRLKISTKLAYQYIAIFFDFSTTSNWRNSRLVVDEDDNVKFRFERVKPLSNTMVVFRPFISCNWEQRCVETSRSSNV